MDSRSALMSSGCSTFAVVVFVIVAGVLSCHSTVAAVAGSAPGGGHQPPEVGGSGRKASPMGLDCERSRFSVDCMKLELVTFLEKMSEARVYQIGGGLSIVQDASANRTRNSDIVAGKLFMRGRQWAVSAVSGEIRRRLIGKYRA